MIYELLALAVATEAMTEVFKDSVIFEDVREYLKGRHEKLDVLLGCGFCLSWWFCVALYLTTLITPIMVYLLCAYRVSHVFHDIYKWLDLKILKDL